MYIATDSITCENVFNISYSILSMQFIKTWHMLCIVATVTGIGVLLFLIKTIVLVFYKPVKEFVSEYREEGMMVCVIILIYTHTDKLLYTHV